MYCGRYSAVQCFINFILMLMLEGRLCKVAKTVRQAATTVSNVMISQSTGAGHVNLYSVTVLRLKHEI